MEHTRQQTNNNYGWNNILGGLGGVVQIAAGAVIVPIQPIAGAALIGSGVSSVVYSTTTNNNDMSITEYGKNVVIEGTIGAACGYKVLPIPRKGPEVVVKSVQYLAPLAGSTVTSLFKFFGYKKEPSPNFQGEQVKTDVQIESTATPTVKL